jgi:hypothetical protein
MAPRKTKDSAVNVLEDIQEDIREPEHHANMLENSQESANDLGTNFPASAPSPQPSQPPNEQFFWQLLAFFQNSAAPITTPPRPVNAVCAKVREPEPFNGTDSRKLRQFLLLCELNFRDRPDAFLEDAVKINYILSYLTGLALDFFKPYIVQGRDELVWLNDYELFIEKLQENFGPHDPEAAAENELESLRMKDNQRISSYIVEFQRLAVHVQWGDSALRFQFYKGLPARIKDEISHIGKPTSLERLKRLSLSIDARYWERRTESNREGQHLTSKAPPPKSTPLPSPTTPRADNMSGRPKVTSGNNANAPPTDKLGPDGKLTAQEKQRCFDNQLCLFCGGEGHMAKSCPKSAAKARATKLADLPEPTESEN